MQIQKINVQNNSRQSKTNSQPQKQPSFGMKIFLADDFRIAAKTNIQEFCKAIYPPNECMLDYYAGRLKKILEEIITHNKDSGMHVGEEEGVIILDTVSIKKNSQGDGILVLKGHTSDCDIAEVADSEPVVLNLPALIQQKIMSAKKDFEGFSELTNKLKPE